MSLRRGSLSLRQRNVRNADINWNSDSDPYLNSDGVAMSDGDGVAQATASTSHVLRRSSNKWKNALDLLDSHEGETGIGQHHSSLSRRNSSIWTSLARRDTRKRILSRQMSVYDAEIQLEDSEMTEKERWEKCQSVRDMAASMQVKRQRKAELMQANAMPLTGYNALKFRKNVIWQRRKEKWNNFMKWFKIWVHAFKTIDGQFGMAVGSYFRFLKWLFLLNICILIIIAGTIVIPQIVLQPNTFSESIVALNLTSASDVPVPSSPSGSKAYNLTNEQKIFLQEAIECSKAYQGYIENLIKIETIPDKIANFLQGKGLPEVTFIFYGHYFNKIYYSGEGEMKTLYIMPVAYILATAAYFILSLILMVLNSAKGFKQSFVDQQSRYFQYSCTIFTAWDFCMTSEKVSRQKHDNLYREFKLDSEHEQIRAHKASRSPLAKFRLFIIRFLINVFVIITLTAAAVAIYYVNDRSLFWSTTYTNEYLLLAIQYAPSLTITFLNAVIPLIFIYIVQPEDYSPEFEIKITLVRTVFLRLSSLIVLIASLYAQIANCSDSDYKCGNCGEIKCWEVYVGQQFYRLVIMDFIVNISAVIFYEYPRRFCVEKLKDYKIMKMIGLPEFDIPRSVLDLIYGQTLCWIGTFFCPIIPLFAVVKLFIIFYLKKASLLRNFLSSARTYRASKSNSFFTIVLLISFVMTTIPVGYSIGKISPSKSCGPFRIYSGQNHHMFSAIGNLISSGPREVGDIFLWLGSVSFLAPFIIILCIAMYYYYIVALGHKKMIELLKDRLAMEGRDKHFLIERINVTLTSKYGASAK